MSRTKLIGVFVLVALAATVLVGCGSSEPTDAGSTQPVAEPGGTLEGTSWNCIQFKVNDASITVPAETPITAQFSADGALSGSGGVNTYNTTYETDGGSITIGDQIATTMMAGEEDAMNREADYLAVLPTAVSYQIDGSSGELVLFGPADNTIARYTPAE